MWSGLSCASCRCLFLPVLVDCQLPLWAGPSGQSYKFCILWKPQRTLTAAIVHVSGISTASSGTLRITSLYLMSLAACRPLPVASKYCTEASVQVIPRVLHHSENFAACSSHRAVCMQGKAKLLCDDCTSYHIMRLASVTHNTSLTAAPEKHHHEQKLTVGSFHLLRSDHTALALLHPCSVMVHGTSATTMHFKHPGTAV